MNNSNYRKVFDNLKNGKISREEAASIIESLWLEHKKNQVFYATPEWIEKEGDHRSVQPDTPLKIIIFNYSVLSDSIHRYFSQQSTWEIITVENGNIFQKTSDTGYSLNYLDQNQLAQFLQSFDSLKDYKIIFVCRQYETVTDKTLHIIINENIIPLFLLIKTCINLKSSHSIPVTYIYSSTDTYLYPFYSGLSGFVRTLLQESSKITCKLIETDDFEKNINAVITEACDENVNYLEHKINKKRFVKSFRIIENHEYKITTPVLRKYGVYLITGGTGGLGLIFADYLSREYQAKLILTGRSTVLKEDVKTKIRHIEDAGSEVLYVSGDISNLEDVKVVITKSKEKFSHINGIFHAAGISNTGYIRNKNRDEIYPVLASKLSGTFNIDFCTKNENLDFIILFSSISSFGINGMSDYAYANSFMDEFSVIRNLLVKKNKRNGKTVSINWPMWGDGGMQIDEHYAQNLEESKGIRLFYRNDGIKALNAALQTECDQFAVLPGNQKKILKYLLNVRENSTEKNENRSLDIILNDIQKYIIEQIHDILHVDSVDIDLSSDFIELGFDIITFTDLINRINEKYKLTIVPTILLDTPTLSIFLHNLMQDYGNVFASRMIDDRLKNENRGNRKNQETVNTGNNQNEIALQLETFLIESIADILKLEKEEIDIDADMSIYGFDSISFTTLANNINSHYNLSLTPALFFEYSSIQTLIDFINTKYKNELSQYLKKDTVENDNQGNITVRNHQPEIITHKNFSKDDSFRFISNEPFMKSSNIYKENEPIAIIGIAGIMPGADNLDEFWKNLEHEKDCITEIPPDRWDWNEYWGDPKLDENTTNVKWGGFINGIDMFDASFFGISPREAILMDPQHRLFLEIVWKTIEDAGYKASDLSESLTGVFVGVSNMDYSQLLMQNNSAVDAYYATGNLLALLSNRISYFFNFNGPSESIDAACASSLVAINKAIQAIQSGDCTQAIAGGVNSLVSPDGLIIMNRTGALSPDGRCKTFSKDANGYVRSEGVGAILLKPLSMAVQDRDHIYALIRGAAENHGGRAKSLTAPNPQAQAKVIIKAMDRAHIDPSTVTYIEAHGTGTSLGDPIEINGLKKAYETLYEKWNKTNYGKEKHCVIGTVKTNIGHLESAAGIAGILKIILSMKNRHIPGILHLQEINPYIELEDSIFYFNKKTSEWNHLMDEKGKIIPLRAGVSSFGFGGANAHIVLEEYISGKPEIFPENKKEYIIIFSAKTKESLKRYVRRFKNWLKDNKRKYSLSDIEYTLMKGREEFDERAAFIVNNEEELNLKLNKFCNEDSVTENIYTGSTKNKNEKINNILDEVIDDDLIKKLMTHKKINKIIELWVCGLKINWDDLCLTKNGSRVSLPSYEFEKRSFWYPAIKKENKFKRETNGSHDQTSNLFYFTPHWKEKNIISRSNNLKEKMILVFVKDIESIDFYKQIFDKSNNDCFYVLPGMKYDKINNNTYSINLEKQDDYIQVLTDLKKNKIFPDVILYLWSVNNRITEFELKLNYSTYSLFFLLHAFKKLHNKLSFKILYFYESTDNVSDDTLFSSLSGLSKSFSLSEPNITLKIIQIKNAVSFFNNLGQYTSNEIDNLFDDYEIVYNEDKRYVRTMKEERSLDDGSPLLKNDGIYLITGGAGALGLLISEYITQKCKCTLILTGRSVLSEQKKSLIHKLEKNNCIVKYIQADISDTDQATGLFSEIKEKYGNVNGVIHAAGTAGAKMFFDKDIKYFSGELKAKIHGTCIIDEITKKVKLDFIILFGSISAYLGDFGQGDYAIGNKFLNDFCEYREKLREAGKRSGKTIVINWPLWKDGGMHLDDGAEHLYIKTSGMKYLEKEEGLEAFNKIIHSKYNNITLFAGDYDRILGFLKLTPEQHQSKNKTKHEKSYTQSIIVTELKSDIKENVLDAINETVSQLLFIPNSQIDRSANFGDYGFDSISLKEFSEKLNDLYDLSLAPTVFFAQNNIEKLASFLIQEYSENIKKIYVDYTIIDEQMEYSDNSEEFIKSEETEFLTGPVCNETKPDIAIIGISGRFPGSKDLDEFWEHLVNQDCLVTEIPKERWDWRNYYGDPLTEDNKTFSKWGAFIADVDKFDPLFFKISPNEAEVMDPQHRLFLECVWESIEDAGYKVSALSGKKIGVYAGVQFSDYFYLIKDHNQITSKAGTGNSHAVLANRISYIFDFHGPSESIDTACSSSLVAFHQAVQSIRNGECEMAIAGGVSLMLTPDTLIGASKMGIISPDGKCKTFDKSANGYVKGEGINAFLLKPLDKALSDHDQIYAVVKGTAVNHGGQAHSLTAPNSEAQAELIISAMKDGGIEPETISYIECHGTGTELGDPVEVDGLITAFKNYNKEAGKKIALKHYCGLGSVKTNIGHLEPAAGTAGLIKLILSLQHRKLPGLATFKEQNPYLKLDNSPFYLVNKTIDWKTIQDSEGNDLPRRAGVSSFGFGGANAHVIIEQAPELIREVNNNSAATYIIPLSAKNKISLHNYIKKFKTFLQKNAVTIELEDIAYTLQTGRNIFTDKVVFIVNSITELSESLDNFLNDISDKRVFSPSPHTSKNDSASVGDNELVQLIAHKDFNKLAREWIKGAGIKWDDLYENKPFKASLPGYSFIKKRYWLNTQGNNQKQMGTKNNYLHPLVSENISTLREQKFNARFNGKEFFISDYVVSGHKVFPALAFIEMARAAASFALEQDVTGFKDIAWDQPFIEEQNYEQIYLNLYPGKDVDFQIHNGVTQQKQIFCQGKIISNKFVENNKSNNVQEIKERCTIKKYKEECYETLNKQGLHYGINYQVIEELYCNDDEVLSRIKLPDILLQSNKGFMLHPVIIDSILQSSIGFFINNKSKLYTMRIPVFIKELIIYNHPEIECYTYMQKENNCNYNGSNVYKYDVTLFDAHGSPSVVIKEFTIREYTHKEQKDHPDDVLYELVSKVLRNEMTEKQASHIMEEMYE